MNKFERTETTIFIELENGKTHIVTEVKDSLFTEAYGQQVIEERLEILNGLVDRNEFELLYVHIAEYVSGEVVFIDKWKLVAADIILYFFSYYCQGDNVSDNDFNLTVNEWIRILPYIHPEDNEIKYQITRSFGDKWVTEKVKPELSHVQKFEVIIANSLHLRRDVTNSATLLGKAKYYFSVIR